MTPFASVAILEKLALLKIAFCRAPAFSSTSSACLREVTSPAPPVTPIRVLVTSFPLAMVLPSGNLYCSVRTELASRSPISSTPRPPWAGYPPIFLGFPPTARAVGLSVEDNSCRRCLRRGRYNGVTLVRLFKPLVWSRSVLHEYDELMPEALPVP